MSLDPRVNRLAREEARAREEAVPPPTLEPPFPFTRVEFDPFFFEGLTLEPKQSTAVDTAKLR